MVRHLGNSSVRLNTRATDSRLGWWAKRVVFVFMLTATSAIGFSILGPDDLLGARSPVGRHGISDNDVHGSMIGELVGRTHRIRIYAAWPEPLYSILDTDGRMIASDLTAEEVALRFPDLPLLRSRFRAGPGIRSESTGVGSPSLPLLGDVPLLDDSDVPVEMR